MAAPASTFDFKIKSGAEIPIEERGEDEVLVINGVRHSPETSRAKNPAFDVTPAKYVTGYITEYGIFTSDEFGKLSNKIASDLFMR